MKTPDKYTINEAVEILKPAKVCRTVLHRMIQTGEVSIIKLLGRTFIPAAEIRRVLSERIPLPGWLTTREAQHKLRIGRTTLHNLIKAGHLKPRQTAGINYFNPNEIDAINMVGIPPAKPQGRPLRSRRRVDEEAGAADRFAEPADRAAKT